MDAARTGDRFAISAYLGKSDKFDKAIADFADAYAYQNEADYQRFMEAYTAGEMEPSFTDYSPKAKQMDASLRFTR